MTATTTEPFTPEREAQALVRLSIRNLNASRLLQLTVPDYMQDPRYLALDAAQGGIDAAIAGLRLVAALGHTPTPEETATIQESDAAEIDRLCAQLTVQG